MRTAMGDAGRARLDTWLLVCRSYPEARISGPALLRNDDTNLVLEVAYAEGVP